MVERAALIQPFCCRVLLDERNHLL